MDPLLVRVSPLQSASIEEVHSSHDVFQEQLAPLEAHQLFKSDLSLSLYSFNHIIDLDLFGSRDVHCSIDRLEGRPVEIGFPLFFCLVFRGEVGHGFSVGLQYLDGLFRGGVKLVEQMKAKLVVGERYCWFRWVHQFQERHDVGHETVPLVLVNVDRVG